MKCGIKKNVKRGSNVLFVLFLFAFFMLVSSFIQTSDVFATASTITLSVTDRVGLNITSLDTTGTFASSDTETNNISVSTNNGTGYLLGIKASTEGGNALVNVTDSSKTIPSHTISAGVSKTNYNDASYASANNLNNTWGFRPSTYYDTTNNVTINNTTSNLYFPGPSSTINSFIIDKTSVANATANEYNIALGTRINNSTSPGRYTNVFVITAVANPILYSITYNQNTTDTVTNMPSNVVDQPTFDETVNISSTVPARDGFNFKGWCTVQTADGGACSGTTYNPDGGGTNLTWTLDQTQSSNSPTLYAMWEVILYMQNVAQWKDTLTTVGEQVKVVDNRDGKEYWVAKQADGNIWMTQNLDLDIGGSGVATLTSENTDLNTSGSAPYTNGYTASGGVITWTPASTATTSARTISGTTVSPSMPETTAANSAPYSVEGGDRYYFTTNNNNSETAQTLAECIAISGRTKELCAHYHVGNYYNWNAAIASNDSSGFTTGSAFAANSICPKGWKLPRGTDADGTSAASQFGNLWWKAGVIDSSTTRTFSAEGYTTNGFINIRTSPLFFVRAGDVSGSTLYSGGGSGNYWASTVFDTSHCYFAGFGVAHVLPAEGAAYNRYDGQSVRCMVR